MPLAAVHPSPELAEAGPEALAAATKLAARQLGADLIGIADPAALANEPLRNRPQAIFPEVAAIIVIGRRITRGSLRGIEEGTNWQSFEMFGRNWLEDQYLSRTAFETVAFLEDLGYEAVPLFGYPADMKDMGIPVRPGQPAPNVMPDVRIAAAAAGLGEIGRHGELITPQFGTLQRLCLILTDAPLQADPPAVHNFCEGCDACVQACPLQAATADNTVAHERGGIAWRELAFNEKRCGACRNGAMKCRFVGATRVERIPAACGRACLASLEARGKLDSRYRNPFRVRPAWTVNSFGEVDSGGRG